MGSNVFIHPTARIHPSALIGIGCWIGPKVNICEGVRVAPYTVIGGMPEHREFYDDVLLERVKGVFVCQDARIFEYVTIHSGTLRETMVGARAAIFNHSHLAHDVNIGRDATVGGHASIAGHVTVMNNAIVSGGATIHQRAVIGPYSILALRAVARGHIPPGEKWIGCPARSMGPNSIGLRRADLTFEEVNLAYNDSFKQLVKESGL